MNTRSLLKHQLPSSTRTHENNTRAAVSRQLGALQQNSSENRFRTSFMIPKKGTNKLLYSYPGEAAIQSKVWCQQHLVGQTDCSVCLAEPSRLSFPCTWVSSLGLSLPGWERFGRLSHSTKRHFSSQAVSSLSLPLARRPDTDQRAYDRGCELSCPV